MCCQKKKLYLTKVYKLLGQDNSLLCFQAHKLMKTLTLLAQNLTKNLPLLMVQNSALKVAK